VIATRRAEYGADQASSERSGALTETGPRPHASVHVADAAHCRPGSSTARLRVLAAGPAFVQNLRHGHYEIATDQPARHRLAIAFRQLAMAI
jgi:hypothetical protein